MNENESCQCITCLIETKFKNWNPEKYNWSNSKTLFNYCKEYKHIWHKDYVIWKLER